MATFLRVRKGVVVLWPFDGHHHVRAVAGDILRADDPLLDSRGVPDEVARQYRVLRDDQTWRCEPAADDATPNTRITDKAAQVYEAIGYDGYAPERAAARAEAAAKASPAQPKVRKKAGAVTDEDLKVPARDPVDP